MFPVFEWSDFGSPLYLQFVSVDERDDNLFRSDHEFSCESDVPDEEAAPIKVLPLSLLTLVYIKLALSFAYPDFQYLHFETVKVQLP